MGLFREQLIRILACLVAIDLAVGVVVLFDRSDRVEVVTAGAESSNTAPPAAAPSGGASGAPTDGVLAGGSFSRRRSPKARSASEAAAGQSAATAPAPPSTASSPSTRLPAIPTGGGGARSQPRAAAPAAGRATTTATAGAGSVTTPPQTDATDQPTTAEDTEPLADAAPPKPSTTGSSAPPKTTPPSSTTTGAWTVISDPTGDTILDSSRAAQANARADMVESRASNTTKGVGFAVKVAQPADPTRDPNWAGASTFVLWEVDTSGDGKPEFEVEYFVEGGKLIAGVSRLTDKGRQAACEAEAAYMSESYAVGIDPSCLGSPASLSYRATVFYGTDPNSDESVIDVSPDGGMSAPLRRTAA